MKRNILLAMAVCLTVAASAEEIRWADRFRISKGAEKYVRIIGREIVFEVPAGMTNACVYAYAPIDLSEWTHKAFFAQVRCRGERLVRSPSPARGSEFSLHYRTGPDDKMRYPSAYMPEEENWDWRTVWLGVQFNEAAPVKDPLPKLVLGIRNASGRVVFDLDSLVIGEAPQIFTKKDNDRKVDYPGRVKARGAMRGVMSRGAFRNTEKDVDDLKKYGANLIRFQMNGFKRFCRPDGSVERNPTLEIWNRWLAAALDRADEMLGWVESRDMMMVLDMHQAPLRRSEGWVEAFLDAKCAARFIAAWEEIARRFKGRKGIYGYDLINEPVQIGPALPDCDYLSLQRRAAEAIRRIDPDVTIIIAANDWSSPQAFKYLTALDLDNVIYQVHMYEPGSFTHQGANGAKSPEGKTVVRYPDPSRKFDKDYLRRVLKPVRDFALRHRAKIYVGEFSASIHAPGAGQYLSDCIDLFEEYGWDWTYHSFREALYWDVESVLDPATGKRVQNCDNDRFRALVGGFNRPPRAR